MANGTNTSSTGKLRRTWITLGVILLVLLVAGAYFQLRPRRIRITTTKPVRQNIYSSISTNGKVEPLRNFEAHAPAPALIQRVLVKEGEHVKAGQLLVELDDAAARSQLAKAQAQLRAAQADYSALLAGGGQSQVATRQANLRKLQIERESAQNQLAALERLQQKGAATPEEVTAARNRLNRAEADLAALQPTNLYSPQEKSRGQAAISDAQASVAAAQAILRDSNIRAPFDGTVYSLPVRQGAFVAAGDMLVQVADLTKVQVRAFVDEPEIGRLALGQQVTITWDALPGRTWQGQLTTVPTTVVARGNRVVGEVLCTVDNSDRKLLPNTNVNTTIVASAKLNALTVPREAIQTDDNKSYLFVLKGNHLKQQEVKTGVSNLTDIEILQGLTDSDTIGLRSVSPSPMTDGVEVKVVQQQS